MRLVVDLINIRRGHGHFVSYTVVSIVKCRRVYNYNVRYLFYKHFKVVYKA